MDSTSFLEISKLLMPEILIEYFKLTTHEIEGEPLHFYFKEKNEQPKEYARSKLSFKGFYPEATLQDFPIRGTNQFALSP